MNWEGLGRVPNIFQKAAVDRKKMAMLDLAGIIGLTFRRTPSGSRSTTGGLLRRSSNNDAEGLDPLTAALLPKIVGGRAVSSANRAERGLLLPTSPTPPVPPRVSLLSVDTRAGSMGFGRSVMTGMAVVMWIRKGKEGTRRGDV